MNEQITQTTLDKWAEQATLDFLKEMDAYHELTVEGTGEFDGGVEIAEWMTEYVDRDNLMIVCAKRNKVALLADEDILAEAFELADDVDAFFSQAAYSVLYSHLDEALQIAFMRLEQNYIAASEVGTGENVEDAHIWCTEQAIKAYKEEVTACS